MMRVNMVCRSVSHGADKATGLMLDLKMLLVLDFFINRASRSSKFLRGLLCVGHHFSVRNSLVKMYLQLAILQPTENC